MSYIHSNFIAMAAQASASARALWWFLRSKPLPRLVEALFVQEVGERDGLEDHVDLTARSFALLLQELWRSDADYSSVSLGRNISVQRLPWWKCDEQSWVMHSI